jgi:mRNA-degrading endonuclease YafQ of YafQ-DinJ toxin-antitoxin module
VLTLLSALCIFCYSFEFGIAAQLELKLIQILQLMKEDVFATQLSTHSLQGKLAGLKACSCGYDCRILFTIEISQEQTEAIVLLDIGTHNEVY